MDLEKFCCVINRSEKIERSGLGHLYVHVIYLGWVAEQGGEAVLQLHALERSNHPSNDHFSRIVTFLNTQLI